MTRFNKILISGVALLLLTANSLFAQEVKDGLTWYTDVAKAYELNKKTKKPIFAFFTGSDWCGWCHRLEANVFHKPGFKEWAKSNVILLELDFPRNKKLPQALQDQNNGLQQFFKVQGFPTIWIFNMDKDATGKFSIAALGSLGYPEGPRGHEETIFIQNATAVLKNK
jgi:protein disulfide-isomerase